MVHDIHIKSYLIIFLKMHRLHSTECCSCELEIIARKQVSLILKVLFQHFDGQTEGQKA